ncbi:atlastin-like isoform X2 [Ostrinia nubilalis]
MVELGRSLQVVDVNSDRSFALDEAALRALLTPELRALPVAVLSVAGAFRGGKSFLLDFFLRYLNASDAERRSGAWLGGEQEPLEGFGWRTGSERNTIGIHIWSRPFEMTLSTGEKVAVVLMDTQGTFDNESTMRESTTIFALSTLLSSVQIYNIKSNLGGDDLQHLQLFTEYARLVLNDDGGPPFQQLKFLVRDWMFTSDQEFGAQGGRRLLDKVLQIKPDQPAQLQEIRQHLRSCFQDIDCFLMAHPGFNVSDKNFKGTLADLRTEFKACLLEFVPLVLAPNRLVPKRINGQTLTAQEFVVYFKRYMDVFNGGDMPTPATIVQATAEAGLLLATEAARAEYARGVEECAGSRAMAPAAVYRSHAQAVAAARELFTARRIMGSRQNIDQAIANLMVEFDSRLRDFTAINEAKLSKAFDEAMDRYTELLLKGTPAERLCVSVGALHAAHSAAVAAVVEEFKDKLCTDGKDKETTQLHKDLKARYAQMVHFNELNNNGYLTEAFDKYVSEMDRHVVAHCCVSTLRLNRIHESAREDAINFFWGKRNAGSERQSDDSFVERLEKNIREQFKKFVQINDTNTEAVVVAVIGRYKDGMLEVFGTQMKCLPSSELKKKEKNVRKEAIAMYHERRTAGKEEGYDRYLGNIEQAMTEHFEQIKEMNEEINEAAIRSGCAEYRAVMDVNTAGLPGFLKPLSVILLPARLIESWLLIDGYHKTAKNEATQAFKRHRQGGRVEEDDEYYDELISRINNILTDYKNPILLTARDLGIPLPNSK